MSSFALFHPLVAEWFIERFGEPTAPQAAGWQQIASGRHTLIAAPTGSGKTLAAFLWSINQLAARDLNEALPDRTFVVYVSPLKALSNDIEKNLREPLRGIQERAAALGMELPEIRVAVRTGDTPASDRARMVRHPPHILITTPESLFILLTAESSRRYLSTAETVIVDEIHAVAGDKRGAHLALSLERLDALVGKPLQRIGLSATQKPIEEVARLLVGQDADCAIVDVGHQRPLELSIAVPDIELGPIATHEVWAATFAHIVAQMQAHRATLVFVSTRRQAERVAHQLGERLGHDRVAAHHGSLSREIRLSAERRLKNGEVPVVVATASLELGIDIGHVDLVCHIGAPRSLSSFLQRVGRSGHWLGATPKAVLYPLTRDELLQAAAAIRAVRAGQLDRLAIPDKPLDILAQQMVAVAASEAIAEDDLYRLARRAYPYRDLDRTEFEALLEMLSEGIATDRGRRSAHLHRDRVHRVLRGRRGARLAAITSGGAIPDVADYEVIEEPAGLRVGTVNEDFAVESMAGDIFLLGNQSWRIRRVVTGKVHVEDAQGAPPTIPFWLGEAPPRTAELSAAVSELRDEVAARLPSSAFEVQSSKFRVPGSEFKVQSSKFKVPGEGRPLETRNSQLETPAIAWLERECGLSREGAEQIVDYIAATLAVLGTVPSQRTIVAERFFDEAGGMQLVVHSPFGGRVNRAWGLSLRKRFCVTFDFELQAAATDDGIVISLGEQHSFPLETVFSMVRPPTLDDTLVQAALASPMFMNRWRWNAGRALAILRHEGGRRVPMYLQRMRAEDLLAAVFPAQAACQDNRAGPVVPPDHPLVKETLENCLREAMDVDGLRDILSSLERGEIRTVAVETAAPSPMSHEILNANPYAFLDDAPLEERRARAVSLRRVDPELAAGIGALDPEAIAAVRGQAWPDVRDAEELHDALLSLGLLPVGELGPWRDLAEELIATDRAAIATSAVGRRALVAAERLQLVEAACGPLEIDRTIVQPPGIAEATEDEAVRTIVQGWMEIVGPTTAADLADRMGLPLRAVDIALIELETRGVVLRGNFGVGVGGAIEWCDRRLLARINRLTLGRLRQEIEPVAVADLIRFLLHWHHLAPGTQLHGPEGLTTVLRQLQGLELPAPAWEGWVLPGRIAGYDPADLDHLCLAGVVAWGRLSHRLADEEETQPSPVLGSPRANLGRPLPEGEAVQPSLLSPRERVGARPGQARRGRRARPGRQAPLAFLLREDMPWLLEDPIPARAEPVEAPPSFDKLRTSGSFDSRLLSPAAREVLDYVGRRGACFLTEIARGTRLVPASVEDALWELVARRQVTGDGLAGLRALLEPEYKRVNQRRHLRSIPGGRSARRPMAMGRWALWRAPEEERVTAEERAERFARQLLQRYGVVFRELLARESEAPPWRALLGIYCRMELRGEIRGGRFVSGLIGEQYALPEAVEALRGLRRSQSGLGPVLVHSGDPLNLVGILTPGGRVSPYSNQVIAYRDGVPVEVGPLGAVRSRLQVREEH